MRDFAAFEPMDMRAVDTIPDGPEWQYEPKWDGFRAIVHRDGARVQIVSKHGQPLERYFPEVVAALRALHADHFSLDGELVVAAAGALSFDALQQRIHPAASRVALLADRTPALMLVFDLLRLDDALLVDRPLRERRPLLESFAAAFPAHATLRLSPATTERAIVDAWFARVGGALDGVIAKRTNLPYAGGRRDAAVKIKKMRTADCVIGGYRLAAGTSDRIGSLLLGLYDDAGLLNSIGFCSSFRADERVTLLRDFSALANGSGFTGTAPGATPSRWSRDAKRDRSYVAVQPVRVLEVAFDQVTAGRIRHGTRALRWRTDKDPARCTLDQLTIADSVMPLLDPEPAAS